MTDCIEKVAIESFVAGTASATESKKVLEHLVNCPDCRQEAVFMSAVRLSLPQKSQATADTKNLCLSDELISLMVDEALPEPEQKQALAHMAECDSCLSAYLSLQRALEEAALNPQNPPEHLLEKAKILGQSPTVTKISFLQRFLGPSPALRFAAAVSAAACVFVLTLIISSDTPRPTGLSPKGGIAFGNKHPAPKPPDGKPDKDNAPVAKLAEIDKANQLKPEAIPKEKTSWLNTITDGKKAGLLAHFYPTTKDKPFGSSALTNRSEMSTAAISDRVGKTLAAIDAISGYLNQAPKTKQEIARSLQALSLQIVLLSAQEGETLKGFIQNLIVKMADSNTSVDSLARRFNVLQMAILESLPPEASASYQLGQKIAVLELAARATLAGQTSKTFASFDLQGLKTKVLMQGLAEKDAAVVNANLDKLIKLQKSSSGPIPGKKVLEIIKKLEEIILQ